MMEYHHERAVVGPQRVELPVPIGFLEGPEIAKSWIHGPSINAAEGPKGF
jgi:hypothetical protein